MTTVLVMVPAAHRLLLQLLLLSIVLGFTRSNNSIGDIGSSSPSPTTRTMMKVGSSIVISVEATTYRPNAQVTSGYTFVSIMIIVMLVVTSLGVWLLVSCYKRQLWKRVCCCVKKDGEDSHGAGASRRVRFSPIDLDRNVHLRREESQEERRRREQVEAENEQRWSDQPTAPWSSFRNEDGTVTAGRSRAQTFGTRRNLSQLAAQRAKAACKTEAAAREEAFRNAVGTSSETDWRTGLDTALLGIDQRNDVIHVEEVEMREEPSSPTSVVVPDRDGSSSPPSASADTEPPRSEDGRNSSPSVGEEEEFPDGGGDVSDPVATGSGVSGEQQQLVENASCYRKGEPDEEDETAVATFDGDYLDQFMKAPSHNAETNHTETKESVVVIPNVETSTEQVETAAERHAEHCDESDSVEDLGLDRSEDSAPHETSTTEAPQENDDNTEGEETSEGLEIEHLDLTELSKGSRSEESGERSSSEESSSSSSSIDPAAVLVPTKGNEANHPQHQQQQEEHSFITSSEKEKQKKKNKRVHWAETRDQEGSSPLYNTIGESIPDSFEAPSISNLPPISSPSSSTPSSSSPNTTSQLNHHDDVVKSASSPVAVIEVARDDCHPKRDDEGERAYGGFFTGRGLGLMAAGVFDRSKKRNGKHFNYDPSAQLDDVAQEAANRPLFLEEGVVETIGRSSSSMGSPQVAATALASSSSFSPPPSRSIRDSLPKRRPRGGEFVSHPSELL